MTSLNERARQLIEKMITQADDLGITVETRANGTLVLDAGVHCRGSLAAGLAMARVSMAGMAEVRLEMAALVDHPWLWVVATSDHPLTACFISQAANWAVNIGDFQAMGSGPACLLNEALEVGEPFAFEETADRAVLVLETRTIPDAQTCQALADQCGVQADHLALLIAPTASLAGSVQIAARSIETALHKLHHLGFGLQQVIGASGRCPIAIPTGDDRISMGRTNDLVIFASQVWLGVTGSPDAQLAELAAQVPSSASPDYGQPFSVTLEKAGDFYAIDPGLFAPAEITLSNLDSGRSFHHGKINQQQIDQVLNVRRSE